MKRLRIEPGAQLLLAALLGCAGCKSVDRFDTGPSGAYCGEIIGGSVLNDRVPNELVPHHSTIPLKLGLTLSTQHLMDYPGRLTSNDDVGGLCEGTRLFDGARLRTVQAALHDVVGAMQITPDHEQDVFTWVDSTCQGTFVSIISLMYDGKVEVRLFKPMHEVDAGAPANLQSGFGVFSLARNDSGCGF